MELTTRYISQPASVTLRRVLWMIVLLITLLVIAALDHLTGQLPVHHLYYLPIILAAVRFGKVAGLLVACASVVLYHAANPHVLRWQNAEQDFMQLLIYIGVGWVTAKLADDAARMKYLALTDDLTGLHNLRSFEARYAVLLKEAITQQTPLALLVLDLDQLKTLNTQYGHLAGAQAIQTLGAIIAQQIPAEAVACRYGGDEFVIAVPNCSLSRAWHFAEGVRETLARTAPTLAGYSLPAGSLTLSGGVASIRVRADEKMLAQGETLFRAADEALYEAKEQGRNCVCA